MRRKSLSEKDVRTVLAIIESYREQNRYAYDEMNKHMGSLTIEEMIALDSKLKKWYDPEKYDRDPEDESYPDWYYRDHNEDYQDEDGYYDPAEYAESYGDYISSYIY